MRDMLTKSLTILVAAAAIIFLLAGCSRTRSDAVTPTETVTVTPTRAVATPTAAGTQSTEAEVLAAYARYWQVYAEAMLQLDESRLREVMIAPRLDRAIEEIRNLSAQGQAVRIVVENAPVVVAIKNNEAVVLDVYKNSSHIVDVRTKQPVAGVGTPNTLKDSITLERVGDSWKVRDSVRQVDSR